MDALLFSNTAATAAAPAGILYNVLAIPSAGNTGAEGIADDLALFAEIIADSGIARDDMIVITTPALATKLRCLVSLKFSNEVLSSSSIPAGEVIAVAAGGLVSGFDGGVTDRGHEEPTPHFDDTAPADISDSGGTLATPTCSIWQIDALAIKVRGEVAWAVILARSHRSQEQRGNMGNDENYERVWQMRRENESGHRAAQATATRARISRRTLATTRLSEAMRAPVEDRVAKWKQEADEMIAAERRETRERQTP